jgi:uncharacterized membrane-anchored protein YitT (DUF2179 family)
MTQWLQNDHVKRFLNGLYDYGLITLGALIVAANVPLFLQPNHVISSGITGIGMLLNYRWGLPIGMMTLAINLPLMWAGTRWGGGLRVFFVRTVYAVAVLTVGIDLLGQVLPPIPSDPLIYTLFGGLLDGVGIGLVLRGRGTTGGTDIIAQLIDRYTGIPFGMVFIGVNGAILLATAFVVGVEPMLYALVVNFISGRVVDVVQEGISYARACMIVTSKGKEKEVRRTILEKLDRGVTVIEARGGYTEAPRPALYVVVSRAQVTVLKRMIADIDPRAFVVVTEAHEVLGEGFRSVTESS